MPEQHKRLYRVAEITLSTTFYLRPKFRQLQRLLGPAYPKSPALKRVSEGRRFWLGPSLTLRVTKKR